MKIRFASTILFLITFLQVYPAYAGLKVVATIRPLHSLVAAVMGSTGAPVLLITGGDSAHNFALKPSQARNLQNADIVFWIGPAFERTLEKSISTVAASATSVALTEYSETRILPSRRWAEGQDDDHDHGHDHEVDDGHIWLDPDNAKNAVNIISRILTSADPANSSIYTANAAELSKRLSEVSKRVGANLASVQEKPFLMYHDAFQYFEKRFGLEGGVALTGSSGAKPGAAYARNIRERLGTSGASCVIAEPGYNRNLVSAVMDMDDVPIVELDPVGSKISPGADHYFKLIAEVEQGFMSCLSSQK